MDNIIETIKRLGIARVAITVTFALMLLTLLVFLFTRVSTSSMVLLYGQIDPKEAGEVISKLEGQGVSYELKGDGTQIYVAPNDAARLRMLFAQEGIPSSGTTGYEIFDRGDSLSTTAFTQDINYVRALEGELVKSITSLNGVAAARVHLVMPKREPFQREQKTPTASVVIKAKNLSKHSIQAIQQLVAASVPGMEASRVAVIDNNGRLLAKSENSNDSQTINTGVNEQRALLEEKLSHTIESLLEKTVGYGKVRAQVSVDLDLDRTTESSELYDPNGQVVRSTQTISDINQEMQSESIPLTVKNAVPTPQGGAVGGDSQGLQNKSNRNQEIINYEISKTVRQYVKESGEIKRLSVAVMVDGGRKTNTEGATEYTPRSTEELERIKTLVKSAIGFQDKRGDELEVVNMPFTQDSIEDTNTYDWMFNFGKNDLFRILEILAFAFVGFLLIMNIIRPFMKSFKLMLNTLSIAKAAQKASEENQAIQQQGEQAVQLKNVSGLVQSESVETVQSLLSENPQQAAKVVNSWLNER